MIIFKIFDKKLEINGGKRKLNFGKFQLFGKSFGEQIEMFSGQERPGHKYIKKEPDPKRPGEFIYYYQLPNGSVVAEDKERENVAAGDVEAAGIKEGGNQTIQDPNQSEMFPAQPGQTEVSAEPPLKRLKDGLDELESNIKEEKFKAWEKLAEHYISEAKQQKNMFLMDMDDVAIENGLNTLPSQTFGNEAIKDKQSILNKFERNEVKGQSFKNNEMTDILRTTLIIKSPGQLDDILKSLEKRGYKIYKNDVDNLYKDKTAGYKHIALKIIKGDNDKLPKELLLMRPAMLTAKFGLGHDLYDIDKNVINSFPKIDSHKEIKEATEKFSKVLKDLSEKFYAEAYKADLADDSLSSYDNLETPKPTQANKKPDKSSSLSNALPKRLALEIKSSLNAIWQPIFAKFKNSSGVMGGSISPDLDSAITLILSSIVTPSLNMATKHITDQLPLFKSKLQKRISRFKINNN